MPLIKDGDEDEVAKRVNSAINRATNPIDVARIHMEAADNATIGIFKSKDVWIEIPSDNRNFNIKFAFNP